MTGSNYIVMKGEDKSLLICVLLFLILFCAGCDNKEPDNQYIYDPVFVEIELPAHFPPLRIPADNPFTEQGIALGKKLFFDPIISRDNSFNCASCHHPGNAFCDTVQYSTGIDGALMSMNTMPLFNLGFYPRYSWDGHIKSIEEDVAVTITQLHGDWNGLIDDLTKDEEYERMFYEAFGQNGIDEKQIWRAIAQFVRSIVSFNSKFDSIFAGLVVPTEQEMRGYELFFTEEGDCFHCHIDPLYTNLGFHNNALDDIQNMQAGYMNVTGNDFDRGKFKVPSLRNLVFTAPYMHDGRFKTLKEVIDFYSEGLNQTPYADSNMKNVHKGGVQLSESDKNSLIAFLKTLTDHSLISDERYSSP
jgi:cytochrome c peroxidase